MGKRNSKVTMTADPDFFDNLFEPNRRKLERKLGVKIGQRKFTKIIKKSGMSLDVTPYLKNLKNVRKTKKR